MSTAAEVIAAHRQVGPTKFSHRGGSSYVEYPQCGCGERMHPSDHAQHVADALACAGFRSCGDHTTVLGANYVCALPEGHEGDHQTASGGCTWRFDVPNKHWSPNISAVRFT